MSSFVKFQFQILVLTLKIPKFWIKLIHSYVVITNKTVRIKNFGFNFFKLPRNYAHFIFQKNKTRWLCEATFFERWRARTNQVGPFTYTTQWRQFLYLELFLLIFSIFLFFYFGRMFSLLILLFQRFFVQFWLRLLWSLGIFSILNAFRPLN